MAAGKITLELTEKEYYAISVLLFAYKKNRHGGKSRSGQRIEELFHVQSVRPHKYNN